MTTPPTDKATLETCDGEHRLSDEQEPRDLMLISVLEKADQLSPNMLTLTAKESAERLDQLRTSLAAANKRAEEAEQRLQESQAAVESIDMLSEQNLGMYVRASEDLNDYRNLLNNAVEDLNMTRTQLYEANKRIDGFRDLFSRQHLQIQMLTGRLSNAKKALEPFASFGSSNTVADVEDTPRWSGLRCENERIVDWFGPTDFYEAQTTLSRLTEANTQENKETP